MLPLAFFRGGSSGVQQQSPANRKAAAAVTQKKRGAGIRAVRVRLRANEGAGCRQV